MLSEELCTVVFSLFLTRNCVLTFVCITVYPDRLYIVHEEFYIGFLSYSSLGDIHEVDYDFFSTAVVCF